MTPDEAKAKVLGFLRAWPGLFAAAEDVDGRGAQLIERGAGKALVVRWDAIKDAAERANPLRAHPYLILLFEDGRQVALADVGFAFAPATHNSGPLAELPATFCFRDLRHLLGGAQTYLDEEGREPEALRAILMGIALVDGARACGFEVGREEKALEALLSQVEARGLKP